MSIHDAFNKILSDWEEERTKTYTDNKLANYIRTDFRNIIYDVIIQLGFSSYTIKSSAGSGNWASVPWLSIIDHRITKTTQDGVYPVYLFRADGSGVYLSLNQGTTKPKADLGLEKAKHNAAILSEIIREKYPLDGWGIDPLELRSDSLLGQSYEQPNIYSRFYECNKIPENDVLVNDLKIILDLYDTIAKDWEIIKPKSVIRENNDIEKSEEQFSALMFYYDLKESGLIFSKNLIFRFVASLLSKHFILLTGLSGSGKTKIAEAFCYWICDPNDGNQTCFVSVGADWTNREPLLGFPNALEKGKYVRPETRSLELIIEALNNPYEPYFMILDEMNLSHVERYFADFLSAMESIEGNIHLHPQTDEWKGEEIPAQISFPKNLFIIGTVNIDETTYMFSPKVLDRANVIEFRVTEDEMEDFFNHSKPISFEKLAGAGRSMSKDFVKRASEVSRDNGDLKTELMPFFRKLQEAGAEFGYRTTSEISTFVKKCTDLAQDEMTRNEIVDAAIMQKLLPKLHGSRSRIEKAIKELGNLCLNHPQNATFPESDSSDVKYHISFEKLKRMHKRAIADGFTSYAEA